MNRRGFMHLLAGLPFVGPAFARPEDTGLGMMVDPALEKDFPGLNSFRQPKVVPTTRETLIANGQLTEGGWFYQPGDYAVVWTKDKGWVWHPLRPKTVYPGATVGFGVTYEDSNIYLIEALEQVITHEYRYRGVWTSRYSGWDFTRPEDKAFTLESTLFVDVPRGVEGEQVLQEIRERFG